MNSKLFHLSTVARRRHNNINQIKLLNTKWLYDRSLIGNYFIHHYGELFSSIGTPDFVGLSDLIGLEVTEDENDFMNQIPS